MNKLFGFSPEQLEPADQPVMGEEATQISANLDPVNHPAHYTAGPVECIDALRSALGLLGFHDYCLGNTLKYVWRYKQTAKLDDLKKARVYLNWAINQVEGLR